MHTRKDYLDGKCTHREYYGQFVTAGTKQEVLTYIGLDRLKKSNDESFNDIPLAKWDSLVPACPGSSKFKEAGDYYTASGGVCLLKEAARQILDEQEDEE